MHRKNNHIPDPFVVEAMLAVQVLEFANELDFSNIELEGDFLMRIKNLGIKQTNRYNISAIIANVKTWSKGLVSQLGG